MARQKTGEAEVEQSMVHKVAPAKTRTGFRQRILEKLVEANYEGPKLGGGNGALSGEADTLSPALLSP